LIRHQDFTINGPSSPSVYLAPLRKYGASNIMGSRTWLFGVTWRHRSRDHSTTGGWLPMGGPWWPCVYLAPLWRYDTSNVQRTDGRTHAHTHERMFRWFYTLSNAMHCIGQTKSFTCSLPPSLILTTTQCLNQLNQNIAEPPPPLFYKLHSAIQMQH